MFPAMPPEVAVLHYQTTHARQPDLENGDHTIQVGSDGTAPFPVAAMSWQEFFTAYLPTTFNGRVALTAFSLGSSMILTGAMLSAQPHPPAGSDMLNQGALELMMGTGLAIDIFSLLFAYRHLS